MVENALRFTPQRYSIHSSFFTELYRLKLRKFKAGVVSLDVYALLLTDGCFLLDGSSLEERMCRFGGCSSRVSDARARYRMEQSPSHETHTDHHPDERCSCKLIKGTIVVLDSLAELRKLDKRAYISERLPLDSNNAKASNYPLHIFPNPDENGSLRYFEANPFFVFSFVDLKNCAAYYYIANPVLSPANNFCYSYFGLMDSLSYTQDYNNFKLSDLNAIVLHFNTHSLDDVFFLYSKRHSRVFMLSQLSFVEGQPVVDGDPTPLDSIYMCSYASFTAGNELPRLWRNFLLSFCRSNSLFSTRLNVLLVNSKLLEDTTVASQAAVYSVETPPEEDFKSPALVYGFRYSLTHDTPMYEHQYSFAELVDSSSISKMVEELNLELITWRILPELKLKLITDLKVCVVGLGTLGCGIIRQFLAWGVEKFVLVDMGSVSNATRQSLYVNKDCHKNVSKVDAAKKMIVKIRPDVKLTLINMEIPMPGHEYEESDLSERIQNTRSIVDSSDVMMLATDTKESRWLPALLASQRNFNNERSPLVVSAGLGFDSCMIVRHSFKEFKGACYFCSDSDPLRDTITGRPLDETCTIVKPGISDICASMAVEMVVSLTQHPDTFAAKHGDKTCLGNTTHSLRFSLSDYKCSELFAEPSEFCICCSENVLKNLKDDGKIKEVFKDPKVLLKHSKMESMIEKVKDYKPREEEEGGYVVL